MVAWCTRTTQISADSHTFQQHNLLVLNCQCWIVPKEIHECSCAPDVSWFAVYELLYSNKRLRTVGGHFEGVQEQERVHLTENSRKGWSRVAHHLESANV